MQILVNKRNEIISYAIIGGFEEGIDIENLPEISLKFLDLKPLNIQMGK
ncbi:hypothetical protein CSB80_0095 [Staphylococcus aureus]|nr:hypothetical protein CSB80_0095 [Staphylococcus aureus]